MEYGIQTGLDIYHARDYADALQRFTRATANRNIRPFVSVLPIKARINHNRWLADCQCGAGVACDPSWEFGLCSDCGAKHLIEWPLPAKRERLAALLKDRNVPLRSWEPREGDEDLRKQNDTLGIVRGAR
mgnify:CR=1 FL=1